MQYNQYGLNKNMANTAGQTCDLKTYSLLTKEDIEGVGQCWVFANTQSTYW